MALCAARQCGARDGVCEIHGMERISTGAPMEHFWG
jgi:hypothetical protein